MWNRREDDNEPRPNAPVAQTGYNRSGASPQSPVTGTVYEARTPAGIGKSVVIRGDIIADEDLHIDGDVEGTLRLEQHRLTIGPNGKVRANIKAREVTIRGGVQGNIETSEKILIYKDGTLVGDVKTAGIVIEDGAYFKGTIDIIRPAAAQQHKPVPPQQQMSGPTPVSSAKAS